LRAGIKGAMPLCQECGDGGRKDEMRPMVRVSALCSLQCFDTDGWVKDIWPVNTPFH